jgi:hypothetical protein
MRKTVLNLVAASVIFIGSLFIVIERYQEERTVAVESGLGLFGMFILTVVALGGISYLIANFKGMIYQKPFGSFAVLMYGSVVALVALLGYQWVQSIENAAQANLELFLGNMQYHSQTLLGIAGLALIGIVITLIEPLLIFLNKRT